MRAGLIIAVGVGLAACDGVFGLDVVVVAMQPPDASAPSDLFAHWTFDEGAGDIANDSSGNGIHGMLINGPQWVAGHVGAGALHFDGVDDHVVLGDTLGMTSSFSVTAWLFADEVLSVDNRIVTHGTGPGNRNWTFRGEYGRLTIEVSPDTTDEAQRYDERPTPERTWIHCAGVYDADLLRLDIYRDGARVNGGGATEIPAVLPAVSAVSTLGRNGPSGDRKLHGSIDDVRIYKRALSQEEIEAIRVHQR